MPEHLQVAILLGAFAGLRVSEAVALRIEDVDFTRGVVFPRCSGGSGCDVKTVQARMRHSSAWTTLDVYGHMWPDKDETTRVAIGSVIAARAASSSGDCAGGLRAKRP
jgi:integrase